MWDLAESPDSIALLESFYNSGKPIALVCHSPGVLRHVTYEGAPLVKGKHVTGFTNGEEAEMQLTKVVPFLVKDELLRLGSSRRWRSGNLFRSLMAASSPDRILHHRLRLLSTHESHGCTNSGLSLCTTCEHTGPRSSCASVNVASLLWRHMRVTIIRRRWLRLVRVWRGTFGLLRGFSHSLSTGAKTVRASLECPPYGRS